MRTDTKIFKVKSIINQLLDVPPTDPDDARRRKLLNVLLLGVGILSLLLFLGTLAVSATAPDPEEIFILIVGSLVMLAGVAIILAINHYRSGGLAAWLFLALLLAITAFSDQPAQVADGRSLFIFALPILMASVILPPYASFITAGISSIIVALLGFSIDLPPNIPAIVGFLVLALISWLAARSLETTLQNLRTINRELDQRVAERTDDLSKALTHVQAESSKNQAILESIADGVIVFDNNRTAIVSNPSISLLLSLPTQDIIGRSINELVKENDLVAEHASIIDYTDRGDTTEGSIKLEWGKKTLSVSLAPVRSAIGETTGTVAVFRDFTREAELDRMKSAFVSMASHELRTPLNAILGYSDMLKENVYGPLQPEQRETMDRVMANTKRMLGLVNNLLDQAQIESGKLVLEIASFSPGDLLKEVQTAVGVLAEAKQLTFETNVEADVPATVSGDARRLNQILINLVGNAVKFTEEGAVRVRAFRYDDTHWALSVSDTGPGIPDEAQKFIFEPFRQVDDPITRRHTGSGLGLSIVEQLTTLMGGKIEVASEIGAGSTFSVILPLSHPQE